MNEFTTDATTAQQNEKVFMMHGSRDLVRLLIIIFIDYLYRVFVLTPISIVKSYSRHPISISCLFIFLFPIYLLLQLAVSVIKYLNRLPALNHIINYVIGDDNGKSSSAHFSTLRQHEDEDEEDDMQQWLERCSICFESKLDLCLDFCKDQFCLPCFQKYVSEVVKASWGLSVTKIRCPVCRVYVPQAEWTKFVPNSIVELYNKFNRPYRCFSTCCPHCEAEVTPCEYTATTKYFSDSRSKNIASMIKAYFAEANFHVTIEQRLDRILPSLTNQQYLSRVFEKSEWKSSTLPDIHHQLITKLIKGCTIVDQTALIKTISREILQLEVRPDSWRRLQFDHIAFFAKTDCPCCEKTFCIQCRHNDSHDGLSCEENMKRLIQQNESAQTNNDLLQTLKWKLENSRNCPNCSIMINRDEGCNKVDCTLCGFSFCWECKSIWTEVGCGYFDCAVIKSKKVKLDSGEQDQELDSLNNAIANSSSSGQVNSTELGVPNVDEIHSRLHNTNSDTL